MADVRRALPYLLACVALAAALALQSLPSASSTAPPMATERSVGRAGFAYLAGVRTFVAAVLWNRIEPQFHEYYESGDLRQQRFSVPTLRAVVLLDPQFVEAYYISSYIVAANGDMQKALQIAREGIANNPDSGLLYTNLAQLLLVFGNDPRGAAAQADLARAARWTDDVEKHDAYSILAAAYRAAGQTDKAAEVIRESELLDESIGSEVGPGAHDHDGDGVPDH